MPIRPPTHRPHRDYRREAVQRQDAPGQALIDQIRHTARWQRVRAAYLSAFPLCNDPYAIHQRERRIEAATQADHIIPLAVRPDLAFTWENLQGLCLDCHARKNAEERRLA
jgi:5-methylcytosine-specific restriction endonuclease McrA